MVGDQRVIAFGTDGIRGDAEQFPFADATLIALGLSFAAWAQERYGKKSPRILIGADTRISSPRIKGALCKGMLEGGVVVIDTGVLPTPAIFQIIFHDSTFDAGVVVSASHNPYHDNGIKLFDSQACKITPHDEQTIMRFFERFSALPVDSIQGGDARPTPWSEAGALYQQEILKRFPAGLLKKVKVVLDCANGATSSIAPTIFEALGATVIVIAHEPNGTNINAQCGSTHPQNLAAAVRLNHADCGFAFDGDGDRVVAVDREGTIKDGDDILALVLDLPAYASITSVVGTIVSNQGFEQYLTQKGKKLIRTKVGEKYVSAMLDEKNLLVGGEPSGHVIIREYLATGDGIFVALKVLESMMMNHNSDMKTFHKFPQVLINVSVRQKKDLSVPQLASIITDHEKMIGDGRIVVRYSGTEPLLRVTTEASTEEVARDIACRLATRLQKALEDGVGPEVL